MAKPKSFLPWKPWQTLLLPPSPVEWLPKHHLHLVFCLLDLAAELEHKAIRTVYRQKDQRGEKACWEDATFRVLTGNQQPDHSRISDFRRRHLDALTGQFAQVLRLCQKAGLVSLGQVALDGTKLKANSSRHRAMSHER